MVKKELTIINKLGIHARAAMKLVNVASGFASEIIIKYHHKQVNAKSIMNLMVLGATQGSKVVVEAEGEDEQAALAAIEALINDRFGESE